MEESRAISKAGRLATGGQGLIASLLSAGLYTLAFPPFNVPELAWVFVVPILLWGLFGRTVRFERLLLVLCGWIAWTVLIVWLRNCTDSLEIPFAAGLGWFLTLLMAFVVSLFWSGWMICALWVVRSVGDKTVFHRLGGMIGMAAGWVLLEWIRGVLFTGFPWLPLSVSQWDRPLLLQVASLTGGYGISFALILVNFGLAFYIYTLWKNRRGGWLKRLSPEFYLAIVTMLGAIGLGMHTAGLHQRGKTAGPKLGFVQPDAGIDEKWDATRVRENLETLEVLSTYASYLDADLVLWPEAPTPLPIKGNRSMQQWVEQVSSDLGLPILAGNTALDGNLTDPDRKWYNAVFFIDPLRGADVDQFYAKRHLVPFGEYVPFGHLLPFIKKFVPVDASFSRGTGPSLLNISGDTYDYRRVGNLICYEDIFPALARENTLAGADWHYVATNNVWFGEEAGAWQHAAHSVLRAVETRRPVVRCGNAGWSGWIDEYGHVRHIVADDAGSIYFQGVDAVRLSFSNYWTGKLSFYVRYGDWFPALCAALSLLAILSVRLGDRRRAG